MCWISCRTFKVLMMWRRRQNWWNQDASSDELNEKYFIHCAPYGQGIDLTAKVKSSIHLMDRRSLFVRILQKNGLISKFSKLQSSGFTKKNKRHIY